MKSLSITACLAVVLGVGVFAWADHHKESGTRSADGLAWFDPAECTICKPMHDAGDLMESMQWEAHKIDNGMVMVSRLDESKVEEYRKVCAEMHNVAAKVGMGKLPGAKCCGFCEAFGKLMVGGAKMQKVETDFGEIVILTSADAGMVEKIHAMADRTMAETEKMAAQAG